MNIFCWPCYLFLLFWLLFFQFAAELITEARVGRLFQPMRKEIMVHVLLTDRNEVSHSGQKGPRQWHHLL